MSQDSLETFLNLGLGLIPVKGKVPQVKHWHRTGGIRNLSAAEGLLEGSEVGVPTGFALSMRFTPGEIVSARFLYVLDVDTRHGGHAALDKLELPETATYRTRNGGLHLWLWTSEPAKSYTRPDGLELKGIGRFVCVPPTPGYVWQRSPWEWGIAECPEVLLPTPERRKKIAAGRMERMVPLSEVGKSCDLLAPWMALVRSARAGSRRETLLYATGKVKHTLLHRGLVEEDVAAASLMQAAMTAGVEEGEALRIIDWSINAPVGGSNPLGGKEERLRTRLSQTDREVLSEVVLHFEEDAERFQCPFEKLDADLLAVRYLAGRTGISKSSVARSLKQLEAARLIWRSMRTRNGVVHPGNRYRPTYQGLALCKSPLWTPYEQAAA